MSFALLAALVLGTTRQFQSAAARVQQLEAIARANPDAANWRALSDAYVASGQYAKASQAFAKASALYAKFGDLNAAKVLEIQAQRYETQIGMFYDKVPDYYGLQRNYTRARYEPVYGCYLGAFIDREDGVKEEFHDNDQLFKDPGGFNQAVGKNQAIYFTYLRYGRPFPKGWARRLEKVGAAAEIVWEPDSLDDVENNSYLQRFADDCLRSGIPIFLRFAGEMNGSWVPYGKNPAQYVQKFRLVSNVVHNYAPNVAMVWCPNEIPEDTIPSYFPGDDAVDWVGVNFYAVTFNDADRARGAEWMNPADSLAYIYHRYSAKHPIMIGEWAATHQSVVDNLPRPDFAATKIAQLYSALPRIYPRVKAVSWLSMNTIKYANPGRQLNDYSLLDAPRVAAAYSRAISSPYFLTAVPDSIALCAPVQIAPLSQGAKLKGKVHLSAFVKTYDQHPTVQWIIAGKPTLSTNVPGSYDMDLDTTHYSGNLTIQVVVKDSQGQVAGSASTTVAVPE